MSKPRLLDLFCGAGGAGEGYARAGFEVIGVDIEPQPHYPFEFIQDDALELLARGPTAEHPGGWWDVAPFDAIHASPPCQAFTSARVIHDRQHPDLLTPTRPLLQATGLPCVIENVLGAPIHGDFKLCGSQFGLGSDNGRLIRHRYFECVNWQPAFELQAPCDHSGKTVSVFGHGGHVYHGVEDWCEVMGIDWMTRDELAQAIPPAFTQEVGRFLLAEIETCSTVAA